MSILNIKLSCLFAALTTIAVTYNDAYANGSLKIYPTVPLEQQLVCANTTYIIQKDCSISSDYKQGILSCNNQIDIVRAEVGFKCVDKITIDNKTYYITPEQVLIYWNESLILPDGCLIVDSQKKQIISKGKIYRPNGLSTVYIGSTNKMASQYKHCKEYYTSGDVIDLRDDEGLLTNDGCVVLDISMKHIESYHPCFIPKKGGRYFVAKREKGIVEYSILKVLTLPENVTLKVKKGQIKDGILLCNGLQIGDSKKQIFSNIVLSGNISNEELKVEWFGCSPENNGKGNYDIISKYVFPSALFTRSNIFHSQKGTYNFTGGYPIKNYHWGYDHNYMMDCNGIEVYGTGPKTIIRGVSNGGDNPADVFCFVDLKNITVRDLSVTAVEGLGKKTHGTNAFSLCESVENITIRSTRAYDLPIVHMASYPDGGKSYTIQVEAGSHQENILIKDNIANNIAYGFDYSRTSRDENDYRRGIRFEGNTIQNAIVGCVIREEVSPNRNETESILVDGNEFKNCQVGMYCMLVKALTISNNRFIKNETVPLTKYYDDCYGLFITGAFNTKVVNNHFSYNDCKSFICVTQYSFYPVWHGEISSLDINGITIKGKSRGDAVDIAADAKTEEQKYFFKNVSISNMQLQ